MAPRPAVLAGFAAIVALIGTNFVAVRLSNVELAPTWGAAARFGVAAWILLGVVLLRRIPLPSGRALLGSVLYGTLMFAVFFGLMYWGLVEVPAGTAAVINATAPLMTFMLAAAAGLERFQGRGMAGGLLVVVGIAIIFGSPSAGSASAWRLAAVLLAAAAAALATIVIKGFPPSHPLATNAVGMSVSFVLLLLVSVLRGESWTVPRLPSVWAAFWYLVASSLVLFPLVVWVVRQWTASATAYALVFAPVVTVPLSALLLGEAIGGRFLAGAAVTAIGVYVGTLWRANPQ